ncbi:CC0125/CC1285 family lipoprotein [Teredinibacter haidensis]|uniref:CC0125/CC1285 family lipoprotein n=1 Tax=Teredinibacter haidensis TaxID=2731755 RepID=UPI0009491BA8|nr:hypothetical protein [Teredinibacter haidensis]
MKYLVLIMCFTLLGCTTAYGPNNLTGGYKEKKLDENSYIVSFFGNGYTSEQQVWNYWIYRCAELTIEKGFEVFSLDSSDKHAYYLHPGYDELVEFKMLNSNSDGSENGVIPVQYYSYSVSTYSSKAIVNMYNIPIEEGVNVDILLDAESVIEQLQPYMDAKSKVSPPDRNNLYIRAAVEAAIKAKALDEEDAIRLRSTAI